MNEDSHEFIEPSTIMTRGVWAVAAAIAVPFCIQASVVAVEMRVGPSRIFGFPYDNYIGLSSFVIGPLLGFTFIWRQFREFALFIACGLFSNSVHPDDVLHTRVWSLSGWRPSVISNWAC
jgi:hypothetical protein